MFWFLNGSGDGWEFWEGMPWLQVRIGSRRGVKVV